MPECYARSTIQLTIGPHVWQSGGWGGNLCPQLSLFWNLIRGRVARVPPRAEGENLDVPSESARGCWIPRGMMVEQLLDSTHHSPCKTHQFCICRITNNKFVELLLSQLSSFVQPDPLPRLELFAFATESSPPREEVRQWVPIGSTFSWTMCVLL